MSAPNSAAGTAANGRSRPDQAAAARNRRSPGSLDAPLVGQLRERIAETTRRLSLGQAGQLAQLAARTGVVWASRAALARMLDISRRTLDRVLAELDGLVFVVAAVEGRHGGTVLVPIWGRPADAPPLDDKGRAAVLVGYLRRAGALDLSPEAIAAARSLRGVVARVICAARLPAKALRILASVLAKLRQIWQRESGQDSRTPDSPLSPAGLNEAAATEPPPTEPKPEPPEPTPEPPPAAQEGLQEGVEQVSATSRTAQPRADTAALRASAERLGIRPANSPPKPPTAPPFTAGAGRHRLLDTAFLRAHPLPGEAGVDPPAPAEAREGPVSQPPIRTGAAPPGGRSLLEVARTWLRWLIPWS